MKQTIRFSGTKAEKEAQAIKAMRFYLGTARHLQVMSQLAVFVAKMLRDGANVRACYRQVEWGLWAVGAEGYWVCRAVFKDVLQRARAINQTRLERMQ